MWQRLRRLLTIGGLTHMPGSGASQTGQADLARYGPTGAQARRIADMVGPQLRSAGVAQFRHWRPYTRFVLGYIEALADLQAANGGHSPRGLEGRTLCNSVLRLLCDDVQADWLIRDLVDPVIRSSGAFQCGRSSALDDYDHWSERPMSGIERFIDDAHMELQQLAAQPEVERHGAEEEPRSALLGQ